MSTEKTEICLKQKLTCEVIKDLFPVIKTNFYIMVFLCIICVIL